MKYKAGILLLLTAVLCVLSIRGCAFDRKRRLEEDTNVFSSASPLPEEFTGAPEISEPFQGDVELPLPRQTITELREQNPDAVGALRIDGTRIDYPVVRGSDNEYYLSHSFEGTIDKHGAVFLDALLPRDVLTRHTLLHGHNLKDGRMFHDLELFKEEEFFLNHRTILYETLYYAAKWQIFSVYTARDSESIPLSFVTDEEFIKYAQSTAERSLFSVSEEFTANDVLLTLNTCSYESDGSHTLVCARLVEIID